MPTTAREARLLRDRLAPFLARVLKLPADDLWRDRRYLRLWLSMATSSMAGQIMLLALPLTAVLVLHASPTQMGWLTAMELLPFLLLSLPSGVWLDGVRKLPVVVAGELLLAVAALSVPIAAALGWLGMPLLYLVGFVVGACHAVAGTAAQVLLTQVVERERLVQAHAKNALANSGSEVLGPGLAGILVKAVGAPLAMLLNALLLLGSAAILRGVRVHEVLSQMDRREGHGPFAQFKQQLAEGLRFVLHQPVLLRLGLLMAVWQMAHYMAVTVQILFATRTLGLSEQTIGLCFMGMGVGTILGSVLGQRVSLRIGPGPCLVVGYAITGAGWLIAALVPAGPWGVAAFALMLLMFTAGAVFIFINFLALRQGVTPVALQGRMTSTMRWLSLVATAPGALLAGWLADHAGLRSALGLAGAIALVLAVVAWNLPVMRSLKALPPSPEG